MILARSGTAIIILLLLAPFQQAVAEVPLGVKMSDSIIKRYQPTINAITQKGWDHSNSVVMHGMEKIYRNTGDDRYLRYIQGYADEFIDSDGSISQMRTTLDGLHPGVLCLFLYEATGDEKYILAAKFMRDHFVGKKSVYSKTPDGAYWHKNNEKYRNVASVDGLYMVYPFLVRYSRHVKDETLLNIAVDQILIVSERSFSIKHQLPFHAWSYDKNKEWASPITGTSSQFWSRASGWYSMALVDVLEYLPEEHPKYKQVLYIYRQLAEGLKSVQHENGLWYQVLDQPWRERNYPESSSTGMIVYSLKKGVQLGLLDSSYEGVAMKGWQGLKTKLTLNSDGGLQVNSFAPGMGSQNSYESYVAIRPVSVPSSGETQHMHGYMGFLMASSVVEK